MTLTKLCKALGWPRLRRWSHVAEKVKEIESRSPPVSEAAPPAKAAIEWPESWTDRGAVRRFDDTRNYPEAAPGIIYARRIATYLDCPIERVLKYAMIAGPAGMRLPDWWERDRYDSYYCTEDQARQIVARIRYNLGQEGGA